MSFDNSRSTFNPFSDYAGVVMEQGRVQTDADWNEQLAETMRREQAAALDTMGQSVVPPTTPFAFQITPNTATGGSVMIGRGRMYVDGILVENHGDPQYAAWDPALAEMSGSPQPPPSTDLNPIAFEKQPYYPGATFPNTAGDYLVYLDVWRQPITFIEDSNLIDPAINVDTTGRLRTQWRVMAMPVASGTTCATAAPAWPVSAGQLTTATITSGPSGPCCLTTGSGYTGVENQFYRVEIHNAGGPGGVGATFKWSRENASVQTSVSAMSIGNTNAGTSSTQLTVASLGRDQVLGFSAGDWVEITTDTNDDLCQPGYLCKIDHVTPATSSIVLTETVPASVTMGTAYTRLIRWDQKGKIYDSNNKLYCDLDVLASGLTEDNGFYGIPVTDGATVQLESGIVVTFNLSSASGSFLPMDYWNFAARTANQSVDILTTAPPRGQHHHYAALSIATVNASGTVTNASNCRNSGPNGTGECNCCCTCTVGVNGDYTTITAALAALPGTGGEICLLAGDLYENVIISGKRNVLIQGCGWQTHVFSASLNSQASSSGTSSGPGTPASESGLAAVFTIVDSTNIELRSFSISAAEGEVGVLLDRSANTDKTPAPDASGSSEQIIIRQPGKGDIDVILDDLILEASTMPAIAAVSVKSLKITDSQIIMHDVRSLWASVYLSGDDMLFARNHVMVGAATQLLTRTGTADAQPAVSIDNAAATRKTTPNKTTTSSAALSSEATLAMELLRGIAKNTPGGIHIAGPSRNVFVVENKISGGARHGVTLGNFVLLDANGNDTGKLTGVVWEAETDCTKSGSTQIPGTTGSGSTTNTLAAGGLLQNIHIERNVIVKMGMAGIGVVGFWDLTQLYEAISIENLSIVENVIATCMQREMNTITSFLGFAYGAISLADVSNLMIRDNIITDFGLTPAVDTCGIFVLHGEMVEVSRNQIRETRDFANALRATTKLNNALRAGVLLALITPPSLESAAFTNAAFKDNSNTGDSANTRFEIVAGTLTNSSARAVYEPGLPALRVQENTVRVALGLALQAPLIYGPTSIVDNHFASGGAVRVVEPRNYADFKSAFSDSEAYTDPLLINVINMGLALEDARTVDGFAKEFTAPADSASLTNPRGLAASSSGEVLFANNTCQLEARVSGTTGFCSVLLLSYDGVLATGNQTWVDGPAATVFVDAMLAGVISVQATGNRFQEARPYAAIGSAWTRGYANVTSQNVATYCIATQGTLRYVAGNLVLLPALCPKLRVALAKDVSSAAATPQPSGAATNATQAAQQESADPSSSNPQVF